MICPDCEKELPPGYVSYVVDVYVGGNVVAQVFVHAKSEEDAMMASVKEVALKPKIRFGVQCGDGTTKIQ